LTEGGIYDAGFMGGGPFGIFSDPRTSDTFQESVDRHNIANAIAANGWSPPTGGGTTDSVTGTGRHALEAMGFTKNQIADGSALRAVTSPGGIASQGTGSGGGGASDRSGQSMGNTSSASGLGNAAGAGIGGLTGHDTTAVGASGQLGHIATGGWIGDHAQPVNRLMGGEIPGDPRQGDTVPIRATPDEFMINRDSANNLGPNLLNALNNPQVAAWLGREMGGFSRATPEASQGQPTPPQPMAPAGPHSRHGDPHLPDAFIDAIMHEQHAARLDHLLGNGWKKNWA